MTDTKQQLGRDERFGFRSRHMVFLPEDELAYEAVLRQAFPHCVFLDYRLKGGSADQEPPVELYGSIAECRTEDAAVILDSREFLPCRKWSYGDWILNTPTRPLGRWKRRTAPQKHHENRPTPWQIALSEIDFLVQLDDTACVKQAERAVRLIDKVASRKEVRRFEYPSQVSFERPGWPLPLVGKHALAWAQADANRWLDLIVPPPEDGQTKGWGCIPIHR